jgi:hypothetical protein
MVCSPELIGQWVGDFAGTSQGRIIVNIDDRGSHYLGEAYLAPTQGPPLVALFTLHERKTDLQFRTDLIQWFDVRTAGYAPSEAIASNFPAGTLFSKYADVKGSYDTKALTLSWTTDIGTNGNCVLPRTDVRRPSRLPMRELDWAAYKGYISSLSDSRYLFRGQSGPFRLRTSFHRSGRANLRRFLIEDIPTLHRNLSSRTKHFFDLKDPIEYGAFFSLVQHHGYPTPLLDWTYSPYVAAFFAYRALSGDDDSKCHSHQKVRVLVFDQDRWRHEWQQFQFLNAPCLHLSIGEYASVDNERLVPQQAATTITNADDIEAYVQSKEREKGGTEYLWAIDLPVIERNRVMKELRYMGITAGSMFPGLDGACEELRQQNFE